MADSYPARISDNSDQTPADFGSSSTHESSQPKQNPTALQDQSSVPISPGKSIPSTSLPEGESSAELSSSQSRIHPQAYPETEHVEDSSGDGGGEEQLQQNEKIEAAEEILVRIPETMVHLADEQGSVLLASGEFSLLRLVQNSRVVAVFAKVGEDFQWPVAKDAPSAKIDPAHYFFTLTAAAAGEEEPEDQNQHKSNQTLSPEPSPEDALNYGVTFRVAGNEEALKELDKLLQEYSLFSTPTIVQADAKEKEELMKSVGEGGLPSDLGQLEGKDLPAESLAGDGKSPTDEMSAAYWTTMAPNVQDYNSRLAKAIASGAGHIIRGIFWCSESTTSSLTQGGSFVKEHLKPGSKEAQISPGMMKSIQRAKKISNMSQQAAIAILSGVISTIGFFVSPLVNSRPGQKFFGTMPGEVALASLDAFGKLFEAVEVGGKNVLSSSSLVTSDVVSHRHGGQAADLTHEGLSTLGYAGGAVWTISKIHNALNPRNFIKPSTLMKNTAKATHKEMNEA